VAANNGCPLDGKLVTNTIKEFDQGGLREYIEEAQDLLGEE